MTPPAATAAMLARVLAGVERFPPPDFTDHQLPTISDPSPELVQWQYVWFALLVIGMALTAYLAIRARSRRGVLLTAIASLILFGFVRGGCVCSIGAIQNVALGLGQPDYVVPWVVVGFLVLPLAFALFFGRVFCAAVCPLGAVQEVVALKPIQVPRWLDESLGVVAYVYLGLAVALAATGTGFIICRYDPFVGFFRLSGTVQMLAFGGALLLVGVFIGRPYCRYLCPLGVLLRWSSLLSKWHLRIPAEECIHCRLCEDACPYGAIREPTVPQTAEERRRGRRRLVALIALWPALVGLGAWLGGHLEAPLARMHPIVRTAELVWQQSRSDSQADNLLSDPAADDAASQNAGQARAINGSDDNDAASDRLTAFLNTGTPSAKLFARAREKAAAVGMAAMLFGGWVGLVIGGKLIALNLRRRRNEWQPDRGACVSCGRCFWYCPVKTSEQKLLQE